MKLKTLAAALVVVLFVFGLPLATFGAGSEATINGTVTGPTGPIASASVKVEYLAKGGLPRRTAMLQTATDGTWGYTDKAGDYRLTFSADGYATYIEVFHTVAKQTYTLETQLSPLPPPTGTIEGRITGATGNGLPGFVYFFKQNADGTWPTGYLWQVATAYDGTYTSGPLPLGTYKVRLFTVHTGVQWYRYVATIELATPIVLDTDGQVVTGIDAQFPPPTP